MPQFISIRRSDPEVGYIAFLSYSTVSTANVGVDDGEPLYMLTGTSADGIKFTSGDDDIYGARQTCMGICANNKGGAVPYNEYGLCQIWGYNSSITKATGDGGATAGHIFHVVDNAVVCLAVAEADAGLLQGNMVGLCLKTYTTETACEGFIKMMGM